MNKGKSLRIRISEEEKKCIEGKALKFGFVGVSEYLRFVGMNCQNIEIFVEKRVMSVEN